MNLRSAVATCLSPGLEIPSCHGDARRNAEPLFRNPICALSGRARRKVPPESRRRTEPVQTIGMGVRFWKTVADKLFPIGDATMLSRGTAPDKTLLKKVNQRLMRAGLGSHSRVAAAIRNGQVTLSGSIQYEHQRRTILRAASGVDGVSQVVDKLTVQPANSHRR